MMKNVHFIGIAGTGLSAIARVLLERGVSVSGSDREISPLAEELRKAGATVFEGHRAENVGEADLVVRSSAVPDDNVEVKAAVEADIPVLKRVDFFGQLLADTLTVGVAGSHGKTTTTAMIAWMLTALNQNPGFIIGSVAANLNTNARAGSGRFFVIEADEYDHAFLGLSPTIAVVTNVEHDHPDCFPTAEDFYQAFSQYVERLVPEGTLLACSDDVGAMRLLEEAQASGRNTLSYGLEGEPDYQARNLDPSAGEGFSFEVFRGGEHLASLRLQAPGAHNVLNSLAALAVADMLKLSISEAALALEDFRGTGRRFEVLDTVGGVTVIDDYAHHPTEIRATLAAARARYPERVLWAVWQPHTYSRTRQLFSEFAAAFGDADRVVVTKVYASRETDPGDFSAGQVVLAMQHPAASFVPELDQVSAYLLEKIQPGDVILTLSAGDATLVSQRVLAGLRERERENA